MHCSAPCSILISSSLRRLALYLVLVFFSEWSSVDLEDVLAVVEQGMIIKTVVYMLVHFVSLIQEFTHSVLPRFV